MTNLLESIVTSDKCVVPSQLVRPSLGVIQHLVDPLVVPWSARRAYVASPYYNSVEIHRNAPLAFPSMTMVARRVR